MLAPMLVFLVRHAHSDPGDPDELRPLSARGQDEAQSLASELEEHPTPPVVVVTSPLLRARQTAEAIAAGAAIDLRVDERLAPGATLDSLLEVVDGEAGPVACVGHQPDCSEIALALTGADPGFPTAGFAELALDA
jgi:phosphohistidine phosphatase